MKIENVTNVKKKDVKPAKAANKLYNITGDQKIKHEDPKCHKCEEEEGCECSYSSKKSLKKHR